MTMLLSPDKIADPTRWKRMGADVVPHLRLPAANASLVAFSVGQGGIA